MTGSIGSLLLFSLSQPLTLQSNKYLCLSCVLHLITPSTSQTYKTAYTLGSTPQITDWDNNMRGWRPLWFTSANAGEMHIPLDLRTSDSTICYVARAPNSSLSGAILTAAGNPWALGWLGNMTDVAQLGLNGGIINQPGGTIDTSWTLYCLQFTRQPGGFIQLWRDGSLIAAVPANASFEGPVVPSFTTNLANSLMPNNGKGEYFLGDVILYDSYLSDAQRQSLEGYLVGRYGTGSKLPASHPYKYYQPLSYERFVHRQPVVTLYSPDVISGLAVWLRLSDLQTRSAGACATNWTAVGYLNLTVVGYSGSDNCPTLSNPALVALNGSKVVQLSATADLRLDLNYKQRPEFTIFLLAKPTASDTILLASMDGSFLMGWADGYADRVYLGPSYGYLSNPGTPQQADAWVLYCLSYSTRGRVSLYRSGQLVTSAAGSATMQGPSSLIASGSAQLAEVAVFDRQLSDKERTKIEGELLWSYGLQAQLPAAHPYAQQAPTYYRLEPEYYKNKPLFTTEGLHAWFRMDDLQSLATGSFVCSWRSAMGSAGPLYTFGVGTCPTMSAGAGGITGRFLGISASQGIVFPINLTTQDFTITYIVKQPPVRALQGERPIKRPLIAIVPFVYSVFFILCHFYFYNQITPIPSFAVTVLQPCATIGPAALTSI